MDTETPIMIYIFLTLGWAAAVLALFAAYRFYRRASQYDNIFQFLVDDIETNLAQFYKMSRSDILGNEPEIVAAHRNMMIMRDRLDEFLRLMEEASGLRLRTPKAAPLRTATPLKELRKEVDQLEVEKPDKVY